MNNKSGIYKITSPSGKVYIGETINFRKRFNRYKRMGCKSQFKLYNSLKKYTVDEHLFEILEECDIEDLKCRERYWQDYYNVLGDKGLNLKLTKCEDKKMIHSIESLNKLKRTIEEKGGLCRGNNPMWGKKHTEETIQKIRDAIKGKYNGEKNPMYGKYGKDHPAYGNKPSNEQLEHARNINMFGKNPMAKIVIDIESGVFYESASELAYIWNINKYTLRSKLNGSLRNNTNFKYC